MKTQYFGRTREYEYYLIALKCSVCRFKPRILLFQISELEMNEHGDAVMGRAIRRAVQGTDGRTRRDRLAERGEDERGGRDEDV